MVRGSSKQTEEPTDEHKELAVRILKELHDFLAGARSQIGFRLQSVNISGPNDGTPMTRNTPVAGFWTQPRELLPSDVAWGKQAFNVYRAKFDLVWSDALEVCGSELTHIEVVPRGPKGEMPNVQFFFMGEERKVYTVNVPFVKKKKKKEK